MHRHMLHGMLGHWAIRCCGAGRWSQTRWCAKRSRSWRRPWKDGTSSGRSCHSRAMQGDPTLLRLVWVNLLANAIKYTAPRMEARIEVGTQRSDQGETVQQWGVPPRTGNLLGFTTPAPSSGWNITRKTLKHLQEYIVGFLDHILRLRSSQITFTVSSLEGPLRVMIRSWPSNSSVNSLFG